MWTWASEHPRMFFVLVVVLILSVAWIVSAPTIDLTWNRP